MPVWLIPLIVEVGSRLIEIGFKHLGKKCPQDQVKIFDKIEKKDNQLTQKMRETYEKH
jgi:hypothetical protein